MVTIRDSPLYFKVRQHCLMPEYLFLIQLFALDMSSVRIPRSTHLSYIILSCVE
jgi:hypothetical protein